MMRLLSLEVVQAFAPRGYTRRWRDALHYRHTKFSDGHHAQGPLTSGHNIRGECLKPTG
jgi:hypothetical protein